MYYNEATLMFEGTWVPLEQGEALAQRNNVYEKLRTIFEFIPGNLSPPPAPKHTTAKPKLPKKPAVPKWGNSEFSTDISGAALTA
jgi:transcription factor MBP1